MPVEQEMFSIPYINRDLFSEHFLQDLLPSRQIWKQSEKPAQQALEAIYDLYHSEAVSLPSMNESQLEASWIRKVLNILDMVFEVQFHIPTDTAGSDLIPDYLLFPSIEDRQTARTLCTQGDPQQAARKARMLGEAKSWECNFDKAPKSQRSPKQQLADYLLRSGVDWGFLTNGRRFRLVHRSVAGRLDYYYEVDLVSCLDTGDLDAFRYFFLFFSGTALKPDPKTGRIFLDQALTESIDYARVVGRDLKDAVYDSLNHLARGFLARIDVGAYPDPGALRCECLALLYRMLFLLYAEHRGLLPLDRSGYRKDYSFTELTRDVAHRLDSGTDYSRTGTTLWGRLKGLSEMIDQGDPSLGVPAYNGGLFSAEAHSFLASNAPGDQDLARAIDLLSRTRVGGQVSVFIEVARDVSDPVVTHDWFSGSTLWSPQPNFEMMSSVPDADMHVTTAAFNLSFRLQTILADC